MLLKAFLLYYASGSFATFAICECFTYLCEAQMWSKKQRVGQCILSTMTDPVA